MRRIVRIVLVFATIFALSSCVEKKEKRIVKRDIKTKNQRSSYTFGVDLASNLTESKEFDLEFFIKGFRDKAEDKKLLLTDSEMMKIRAEGKKKVAVKNEEKKNWIKPENNEILSEKFLYDNKSKEGVIVTNSGLQYKVLKQGNGQKPKLNDVVLVNYIGKLRRGEEFDNSYKTGKPVKFKVGEVIQGWQEGLQLMPVGSKYMLYIPPKLAYGNKGTGKISPNSVLIFEVELLDIIK